MYTSNDISLSVLDQIPIRKESSASDALNETINLAVVCDNLGYQRYWVAEHHNSKSFTGNSPEILITAIAEKTNHIRVGSGGARTAVWLAHVNHKLHWMILRQCVHCFKTNPEGSRCCFHVTESCLVLGHGLS